MTPDQFDDFDDLPPGSVERPALQERRDYADPPPKRRVGFGFWLAVAWCLLYLIVSQFLAGIAFISMIFMYEASRNGAEFLNDQQKMMSVLNGWMLWIAAGSQFVGLLVSLLLLRLWCGKKWKRSIALTHLPSPIHFSLIIIGIPAMLALSESMMVPVQKYVPSTQQILNEFNIDIQMGGTNDAIAKLIKDAPWMLAICAVGIAPGICEEMFCRGFLAQGLAGRYQTWLVVLITSFLFGCIHLDPHQGIGAMMLGAAIHGAYVATRSLPAAMFVHFANNGLGVFLLNGREEPLDPFGEILKRSPVAFIAASVVLFLAIALALYQTRSRLESRVPGLEPWQPDGVSSVELPPPNSGTFVTHDPLSPISAALIVIGAVLFGLMMAYL